MKKLLSALAVTAAVLPLGPVLAEEPEKVVDILVFSETTGFRHASIADGIKYFERLAATDDVVGVDFTAAFAPSSTGQFTDANLKKYDVVAFLSTTGNPLDTTEQAAFERYIKAGGGYLGVHASADSEYTWPWYGDLVGGQFKSHPNGTPKATIDVEDTSHASTAHLPKRWTRNDEWYNYRRNPRKYVCNTEPEVAGVETQALLEPLPAPFASAQGTELTIPEQYDTRAKNCGVHVLLSLDEKSYTNNAPMGDHPIAWCQDYDGGQSFYTGLGHTAESYTEPDFAKHLLGGVISAAGLADCPEVQSQK